jgi:periplasmic divalent cation tolerance protein
MSNAADRASQGHASVVVIRTTYPDRASAEDRGGKLVAGLVAACVQIEGPIESTYVWQGAIERAVEWRCTIKTAPWSLPACLAAIRASHPYAVPEVIWEVARATPDYAAWVEEVTARPDVERTAGEQP